MWQPKQEFESGPLVRLNGGLTPFLRLVGMIACVAIGRPAPSAVVNFALNSWRPRAMSAGRADGPAAAIVLKSRWEPSGKTRSSQLPPDAEAPMNKTDAAHRATGTPKSRFMVLPSPFVQKRRRARAIRRHHSHVEGARRKRLDRLNVLDRRPDAKPDKPDWT